MASHSAGAGSGATQGSLDAVKVDTAATVADLANATDGLGALKIIIDAIQTDLDNGTDGLGALKALLDAIPTTMVGTDDAALASVLGILTDVADDTVDTATIMGLARKTLSETKEIERHLHNWERWFAKKTAPTATRFADNLSVLALASDDPWTRLTPGAVNVWGSDVQIWGTDDAAAILPSEHRSFLDFHRLRLHDAADDKKTYLIQIIASETSADDGRTAGTYTDIPVFGEKGDKPPAPIEVMMDKVSAVTSIWARLMTIDGTATSTLDLQFGVHGYPA